jgi:hypothetical protein
MEDEVSANPPGADETPLIRTEDIAERFRGLQGEKPATDETSADEAPEGAAPDQTEAEPTETEVPDETSETEEQPKGRYRVKVNGEERLVTFDELRKGFQLESDYRQKTSKLAEERKALEAERAHYAGQLNQIVPALQSQLQDKFANVDWLSLSKTDPAKYVEMRAEFDQYATRLQIAQAEQQRIESQTKAQRDAEFKQRLADEQTKLSEKLPDFGHPEKGKALRADMKSHLKDIGYSDEEIAGLADHRAAIIAYESLQYRKAQKAKGEAAKQGKVVPQVQKPGTSTRADPRAAAVSAATERFGKTNRVEDLAEVLRARNRQR